MKAKEIKKLTSQEVAQLECGKIVLSSSGGIYLTTDEDYIVSLNCGTGVLFKRSAFETWTSFTDCTYQLIDDYIGVKGD